MAGTLDGTVINRQDQQPLADVLLKVEGHGQNQQQTTGGDGAFSFSLPAGNYDLTASKGGFEPGIYGPIVVLDDNPTTLSLSLVPQMG